MELGGSSQNSQEVVIIFQSWSDMFMTSFFNIHLNINNKLIVIIFRVIKSLTTGWVTEDQFPDFPFRYHCAQGHSEITGTISVG
jgi:hypothetical protein